MKYEIQRLYEWPRTPRFTAIGVICLLVFYLGYFFDISSLRTHLNLAYQQEADTSLGPLWRAQSQPWRGVGFQGFVI